MAEDWKILLIDDDAGIRRVTALVLEEEGYIVLTAPDGETGVRICEEESPQIVITDIGMPRIDGLEVLKKIKAMDPDKEVIVATAFTEIALAIKAMQLDASGFVTKPVSDDSLRLALDRAKDRYSRRKDIVDYATLLENRWIDTSEELARSFYFKKMLIEGSIDGIFACDGRGKIIIYSPSMEAVLGYPGREVLGKMSLLDFFMPGEAGRFQDALYSEENGDEHRLFPFEARLMDREGNQVPVLLSATALFQDNEQIGIVVFFRDLRNTSHREAEGDERERPAGRKSDHGEREAGNSEQEAANGERQARSLDGKYRAVFDCMPNPVFILDRKNLRVMDCNRSVRTIYGYDREEIVNTSFLRFFEEREQQSYALELRNSSVLNHVAQATRDGRTILVNILVAPFDYGGRPALLVSSSDVIRILTANEQLIQASKMATLGEMAAGIAHELNQPLSVIKTVSSFLLNRVQKGEEVRDAVLKSMVEEVDSHVDRATGIIGHIREFGRKSEGRKEEVDVNVPLGNALDIFSQQLKLREIQVERDLAEDLPPIMADRNRLEQVFINILLNARDAIEEKRNKQGRASGEQMILVKTGLRDGAVRVELRDTGTGIPKAVADRIFEPFFTTKEVGRGTGLGLPISYGIVRDHNGTFEVESVEGEGSTFIIQLPVQVNYDGC
jgi:PAS domain S-box-containing protein